MTTPTEHTSDASSRTSSTRPRDEPPPVRPRPIRRLLHRWAGDALAIRERALPRDRRIALVLSHMRSGSSLLLHLLLQHPDVAGAGERNQRYRSHRDFDRLAADAYLAQRRFPRRARVFVDQINHDRFLDRPSLLEDAEVRPVFLLRRPKASLASMVRVLGRHYDFDLDAAERYYRRRLAGLGRLAEGTPRNRAIVIRYEGLVDRPEPALAKLAAHLELGPPRLDSTYPTHRFTGRSGDPSPRIRHGRIAPGPTRDLALSADAASRLESDYDRLHALLEDRFEVVA